MTRAKACLAGSIARSTIAIQSDILAFPRMVFPIQQYDCIIVGGGPAGSTALRQLARAGVNACVIDKATFPRYKPCGGAISALTARHLAFDWSDTIEASLHTVQLSLNFGKRLTVQSEIPIAHFVMRDRFDYLLLQEAIAAGGKVHEGVKIEHIQVHPDHVEITTAEHGRYRAPVLIGADGANSIVARQTGLFDPERGIAIEAEIDVDTEGYAPYDNTVFLNYGTPTWGYGWVFPKSERLSVGVAVFQSKRHGLKDAFHTLLSRLHLNEYPLQVYGHPIPTGGRNREIKRDRVLLAGDAAGLNDPLSGEGIAHAVHSGKIAAEHVAAALESGDFSFNAYAAEIDEKISQDLRRAAWLARKLYSFPRPFFWLFQRSPATLQNYFRIISGDMTYSEFVQFIKEQLFRFNLLPEIMHPIQQ